MYSDRKKKRRIWLAALIVCLLLGGLIGLWAGNSPRDLSDESAIAIRDAIHRSALQCYAVEGVYPPNLEYLEENYGLQVNREDFYIRYEAFASNQPPDIIVRSKQGGGGA